MLILMFIGAANIKAQVTMGANTSPQAFSALELISNQSMGLRLPQMTTQQRDLLQASAAFQTEKAGAAKGLQIFNTETKCVETWNGEEWISTCAAAGQGSSRADRFVYDGMGVVEGANGTYATWTFPAEAGKRLAGTVWMIDNSREGGNRGSIAKTFNNNAVQTNGFYYTWDQANEKTDDGQYKACPKGWSLPTEVQATALINYLNSPASMNVRALWGYKNPAALAGAFTVEDGNWSLWGERSYWWISGISGRCFISNLSSGMEGPTTTAASGYSVRCVSTALDMTSTTLDTTKQTNNINNL